MSQKSEVVRKTRVLFLSFQSNLSGAPRSLFNIVKHIDREKFEPHVLFNFPGPIVESFESIASTHHLGRYKALWRIPSFLNRVLIRSLRHRAFNKLVKRIAPDVIYINTVSRGDSAVWSMAFNIPKIVHLHEIDLDLVNQNGAWLEMLCNNVDRFIGCAEAVSDSVRKWLDIPSQKVVTAVGAIEVDEILERRSSGNVVANIRKSLGIGEDELVIGSVGKPSFRKGIDLFIEAALRVCSARSKVHFVWVGGHDGIHSTRTMRAMHRLSEKLGSRFHWVTEVEDAGPYQQALDIYVVPSRWDPFPFGMLEAMLLEKPVVGFRVSGIPEAIIEGTGVLVDMISPDKLADALMSLLDRRDEWKTMGVRGSANIKQRHDIESVVRTIENTIQRVASDNRRESLVVSHDTSPNPVEAVKAVNVDGVSASRLLDS